MRIAIIGSGVVGQATGKMLERYGNKVVFFDKDERVVEQLKYEEKESFKTADTFNYKRCVRVSDVILVCVQEKYVGSVIEFLSTVTDTQGLIVIRSTVPPGTVDRLRGIGGHICSNPEFLREAVAEYDALNPPGIIIGECCKDHGDLLEELYKPLRKPIHRVAPIVAEMTKLAVNGYLATQISYWDQVKLLCDKLDVNSHTVGSLACFGDGRVSPYGSRMHGKTYRYTKCLPKDLKQLIDICESNNVPKQLFEAVRDVDEMMDTKGVSE